MNNSAVLYLLVFLFWGLSLYAQKDSIRELKEVIVSDSYINKSGTLYQSVTTLNDSVIRKNENSLTNLLNYNSVIYFKDYSRGQLSTVAFRGTTAQQTAVIWNGININSQMNGMTDFSTINTTNFNSIQIKGGGGSVAYGSGALGGSVHLNNDLLFEENFNTEIQVNYGSYATIGANYKINASTKKWSTNVGFSYNISENEYDYIGLFTWKGEQRKNINGQFNNSSLNANVGYKINNHSILKWYSQTSEVNRNISVNSLAETKTKYSYDFNRNLLSYENWWGNFKSEIKAAYLFENYAYYPDINSPNTSFGTTKSIITKLDLGYQFDFNLRINALADYNHTKGEGSGFGNHTRQIGSGALHAIYEYDKKWNSEIGIRQEITDTYKSPFLFSLGSSYKFTPVYTLKINASRNYRIPTFNDLYWKPGGNLNVKPESSYQFELGNVITLGSFSYTHTVYYNDIKDFLQWLPNSEQIWSPQNTDKVAAYGTESKMDWIKKIHRHRWHINGTYAFTRSENKETQKQLFFVPYHKVTGSVAYSCRQFTINYQFLYTGFVFTQSDNTPDKIIDPYAISNIGVSYTAKKWHNSVIGFQVLNAFNIAYQSIENKPLPGRNFNIYINLKF